MPAPNLRSDEKTDGKTEDQKMEETVGGLLRTGVSLAALVVLAGGVLYLARHGQTVADYHIFSGEPDSLTHARLTIRSAFSGRALGIIQLGLLLLIATPVARVAFCIWGFARERDFLYVTFSSIVLAILLFSLFSGSH
jgi:uncharacterized membrane protein